MSCLIFTEYALRRLDPLIPKNKADEERDAKYHPFRRNDINTLNRWFIRFLSPIILPRYMSAWIPYM